MLSDTFDNKTRQALCTQAGGAIATFILYPLDTVRFRTMSHDSTSTRLHHHGVRYSGLITPVRLILQKEGASSLFKGVSVACGGAVASWGIYIYLYRSLQQVLYHLMAFSSSSSSSSQNQQQLEQQFQSDNSTSTSFFTDCLASTTASVGTAFLTTPIWHIKTRMQLEDMTGKNPTIDARRYAKFHSSLSYVIKTDGAIQLWRGFSPQVLMSVVNGVYFPIYQRFLELLSYSSSSSTIITATRNSESRKRNVSSVHVAIAASAAKTLISFISNPLFVVRTRLQDERHSLDPKVRYRNFLQCCSTILKLEGARGFYRGLGASLVITAPKQSLTMVVAEKLYSVTTTSSTS